MTDEYSLPEDLVQRVRERAQQLFSAEPVTAILESAVERWLVETQPVSEAPTTDPTIEQERRRNNAVFERLAPELERQFPGQYVVVANGKLCGVGDSLEDLRQVAEDAPHRLVYRIGRIPSPTRALGWRVRWT